MTLLHQRPQAGNIKARRLRDQEAFERGVRGEKLLPCRRLDKEGPKELQARERGERGAPGGKNGVVDTSAQVKTQRSKVWVE